jgi:hypothetical protein
LNRIGDILGSNLVELVMVQQNVANVIAEFTKNAGNADSGIFRNFDERKIYTFWNFPKATNEAKLVGSILSVAETCVTRFISKLIPRLSG